MPPSRATALRPALLVLLGLVVLTTAAVLALRERGAEHAPPAVAPLAITGQPETAPAEPPVQKPSFDVVRINPQGDAVMAGHAAPGSEVTITDGGKELGRVQADSHGDWVFVPSAPLAPGARELTLAEKAPGGAETQGDRSVVLVVPAPPGAQAGLAANAPPPMAVLTGRDAAPVMLTGPDQPPGTAAAPQLALGAVQYDPQGAVRLSGNAPPSATVRIYVDNRPVGQATADADGRWTLVPGEAIGQGTHRLRLDQIAPNGTVASRLEQPFMRETLASAAVQPGHVVIQPGQNLWLIARSAYGSGMSYMVIYQANRQGIRDPNLIYPGQVLTMPAAAELPAIPASSSKSR